MSDLLSVLRAAGLTVVEVARYPSEPAGTTWRTRERPGAWNSLGLMWHHTAGTKSLDVIVKGRPNLAGPLANLHFPKDGTVNLVSDGRCNHAGAGASIVRTECARDIAPIGSAKQRGLGDDTTGNGDFYGCECENLGDGSDPWPAPQLHSMAVAGAAICEWKGWTYARNVGHLEWTQRKPDPRGFAMHSFRSAVLAQMNEPEPAPPGPYYPEDDMTPVPIKIVLDGNGNGYTDDSRFTADRLVSVEINSADPNTQGYGRFPKHGKRQQAGVCRIVWEGGTPGGRYDATAWVAGQV